MELHTIAHLVYPFVLGVSVYRSRRCLGVTLKTTHRAFTVFREAIYSVVMRELNDLALTGAIEMDETLFGGKRQWMKNGNDVYLLTFASTIEPSFF